MSGTAELSPADLPPLRLGAGARALEISPPFVLAPMEGVTHRVFRDVILDLTGPRGGPGAVWTEFLRVSQQALRPKHVRKELGQPRRDVPVGVQLMGTEPALVAESARSAQEAGAPTVDLNFGCPAPRVFNKCAGSALLAHPEQVGAMVAACAAAVEVPLTAKIRLGVGDASLLREIVAAVEEGGAAMLTVHARTRDDHYKHPARWEWLARVRQWTQLPLVGNGDVFTVADAARMRRATGVDGVMIGRGALRDPWLLGRLNARYGGRPEPQVGPREVWAFHQRYQRDMLAWRDSERSVLGQLKQIYRRLDVGLAIDDETRTRLLRTQTLAELADAVRGLCGEPAPASQAG